MSRFAYAFAFSLLAATVAASGCSHSLNPAGPSGGPLTDRISGLWTLVTLQAAGEQESVPPAGATFLFRVVDGRASVTADCNRCGGADAVGDDSITLGPALACTRAYCVTSAPFDTTFVRLLADEDAATIQGDTLTLQSASLASQEDHIVTSMARCAPPRLIAESR